MRPSEETLLRTRARRLADRRPPETKVSARRLAVLLFRLGPEVHALPLGDLEGTDRLGRLTPVPGAAPELLGLTSRRGEIHPVFDLARLLGLSAAEPALRFVLWLRRGGPPAGLAVAGLEGTASLDPADLIPSQRELLSGHAPAGVSVLAVEALRRHPCLARPGKGGTP